MNILSMITIPANGALKVINFVVGKALHKKVNINLEMLLATVIHFFPFQVHAKPSNENLFKFKQDLISQRGRCPAEDEILLDHHVIKNVPNIQDAKIIFYLEEHNNILHQINKLTSFRILSNRTPVKDTLLIEGMENTQDFPCDKFLTCIYPEHGDKMARQSSQLITRTETNKTATEDKLCREWNRNKAPLYFAFRMDARFQCRGWDMVGVNKASDTLYTNLQKIYELLKPISQCIQSITGIAERYQKKLDDDKTFIQKFKDNTKQFLSFLTHYRNDFPKNLADEIKLLEFEANKMTLQNIMESSVKQNRLMNSIYPKLDHYANQLLDDMEKKYMGEGEFSTQVRNSAMVASIEKACKGRKNKKKIFIAAGRKHLISDEEEAIVQEEDLTLLPLPKKGTEIYPLRKYLEGKPHAYILPKKQQTNRKNPKYKKAR